MENKLNATEYNIPLELFADVLRILLKNKIPNQVTGIKSRSNIVLLKVNFIRGDKLHAKAQENIESMLGDFHDYLDGLTEAVLYGDDAQEIYRKEN